MRPGSDTAPRLGWPSVRRRRGCPAGACRREIQVLDLIDSQGVEQCGGEDVHSLVHPAVQVPDELGAEQLPGRGVAGDPQVDLPGARVVRLVVVGDHAQGKRGEATRRRLVVAQAGESDDQV